MRAVEIAVGRLPAEDAVLVESLASEASRADGVPPLDDQVRLDLRHGEDPVRHLLVRDEGALLGYGYVSLGAGGDSGHLVVAPAHRRHGVGTAVVTAMSDLATPGSLRLWSHGDLDAARGLATGLGFRRVRDLWQMAGPLTDDLPEPAYPDGVTVRTFVPGQDEEAWVEVNAAAFSHHPEQGRMTAADLRQRMAEPWFDPAGFFLAERDGTVLGFHWTKVHPSRPGHPGPVGEVYVLGVSPSAQGLGLGTSLTATGLRHLRRQGLDTVLLYVEASNRPAIAVYEKLGLKQVAVDVMYERP